MDSAKENQNAKNTEPAPLKVVEYVVDRAHGVPIDDYAPKRFAWGERFTSADFPQKVIAEFVGKGWARPVESAPVTTEPPPAK